MNKNYNLKLFVSFLIVFATFFSSCSVSKYSNSLILPLEAEDKLLLVETASTELILGNERLGIYLPVIEDAKIALVVNHTSLINQVHLVDSLSNLGIQIEKIFALEHGYRGNAANGEEFDSSVDPLTGIPIVSLYGKNKKPKSSDLKGIDIVVFDIQDVGLRFYTYISSMHYIMEACAEENTKFMVLDRPNPHGHYFDGPVLDSKFQSFIGMHKIPVVHGLTIGELAWMINEEKWINKKCELLIVKCKNYTHQDTYELPVKPSPNLPNMRSVYLYPTLCFFEGTVISVGRGTNHPFQRYGHPLLRIENDSFVPSPNEGSKYPKLEGETCYGRSFIEVKKESIRPQNLDLRLVLDVYNSYPNAAEFFLDNNFFDLLAGNDKLRKQIIDNCSFEEINESWAEDLQKYQSVRSQYLLYPDSYRLN